MRGRLEEYLWGENDEGKFGVGRGKINGRHYLHGTRDSTLWLKKKCNSGQIMGVFLWGYKDRVRIRDGQHRPEFIDVNSDESFRGGIDAGQSAKVGASKTNVDAVSAWDCEFEFRNG